MLRFLDMHLCKYLQSVCVCVNVLHNDPIYSQPHYLQASNLTTEPQTFHKYSDSIYLRVMDVHVIIIARRIRQFPSVSIPAILHRMTV